MDKTFFQIEEIQKKKLWIFFGLILLFYVFSLMVFSGVVVVACALFNPRMISGILEHPLGTFLVVFVFATILSLLHWYYSLRKGADKILQTLDVQPPDPEDRYHHIYKNIVAEMSIALGQTNLVPMIYNSTAINAISLSTWKKEGYLILSEGAISRLSRAQLQALVAQGVARCATGEAFITTAACSLGGVYEAAIKKVGEMLDVDAPRSMSDQNRGGGLLWLVVIQLVLLVLQGIFSLLNIFLSRENGLRADVVAVKLTRNPIALAEAFYIASYSWRGSGVKGGLAPLYALPGGSKKTLEEEARDSWFADLFKTHPPTYRRVQTLIKMAHEEWTTLDKALKAASQSPPITQEAEELGNQSQEEWFVQSKGEWKGPFNTGLLLQQPFLSLDSWVRVGQSEKTFPLYAIPTLATHFKGKSDGGKINCPACQSPLMFAEKTGLKVRMCPECKGFLVTRSKTIRITARREEGFSSTVAATAATLPSWQEAKQKIDSSATPLRNCSSCQKAMTRKPYNIAYPIEIDKCLDCELTWFDHRELKVLQFLMEQHRLAEMDAK